MYVNIDIQKNRSIGGTLYLDSKSPLKETYVGWRESL